MAKLYTAQHVAKARLGPLHLMLLVAVGCLAGGYLIGMTSSLPWKKTSKVHLMVGVSAALLCRLPGSCRMPRQHLFIAPACTTVCTPCALLLAAAEGPPRGAGGQREPGVAGGGVRAVQAQVRGLVCGLHAQRRVQRGAGHGAECLEQEAGGAGPRQRRAGGALRSGHRLRRLRAVGEHRRRAAHAGAASHAAHARCWAAALCPCLTTAAPLHAQLHTATDAALKWRPIKEIRAASSNVRSAYLAPAVTVMLAAVPPHAPHAAATSR